MFLIDRAELRERVNRLYATATPEQQKILLGVMELIESAQGYEKFAARIPGEKGLDPCPFCGNEVTRWPHMGFGVVQVIECKTCKCRFVFPWYMEGPELAEQWNRRANDEQLSN